MEIFARRSTLGIYNITRHSDDCIAVEFLDLRSREASRVRWYNTNSCGRRHFIAVAVYRAITRPHLDKSELKRALCACNHLEFVYPWTCANMNVAIHAPSTITNSVYHSWCRCSRRAFFFFCAFLCEIQIRYGRNDIVKFLIMFIRTSKSIYTDNNDILWTDFEFDSSPAAKWIKWLKMTYAKSIRILERTNKKIYKNNLNLLIARSLLV